jgi:hypothetical protein
MRDFLKKFLILHFASFFVIAASALVSTFQGKIQFSQISAGIIVIFMCSLLSAVLVSSFVKNLSLATILIAQIGAVFFMQLVYIMIS